jgi:hypothetical protein
VDIIGIILFNVATLYASFLQGAVKLYNQMHESREMAIEDNKKIMAEMAATTGSVLEKLVSRFVSHHELQDSHLDSMLHTLAEKDFHRPVVVSIFGGCIDDIFPSMYNLFVSSDLMSL